MSPAYWDAKDFRPLDVCKSIKAQSEDYERFLAVQSPQFRHQIERKGTDRLERKIYVRAAELEYAYFGEIEGDEEDMDRMAYMAPPANIKTSVKDLYYLEAQNIYDLSIVKAGFKIVYELDPDEYRAQIIVASDEVIEVLNKRSDFKRQYCYTTSTQKSEVLKMIAISDIVIDLWKEHLSKGTPYPEAEIEVNVCQLEEIEERWEEVEEERRHKAGMDSD